MSAVIKEVFSRMPTVLLAYIFVSGLIIFYLTPVKSLLSIPETVWNPFTLNPSGELLPIQELLGRIVIVLLISIVPGLFSFYLERPLVANLNSKIKNFFLSDNSIGRVLQCAETWILHKLKPVTKTLDKSKNKPLTAAEEVEFSKFLYENKAVHDYLSSLTLERTIFHGCLIGVELSIWINLGILFLSSLILDIAFFISILSGTATFILSFYLGLFCLLFLSVFIGFCCWCYNKAYFHNYVAERWDSILDLFERYKKTDKSEVESTER